MATMNINIPTNADVLAYLKSLNVNNAPLLQSPQAVDPYGLLTHPDLVEYFWKEGAVSADCKWVVYGRPALIHPATGVLYGIASGTSTLVARLPAAQREAVSQLAGYGAARQVGDSILSADAFGEEWVFLKPFADNTAWMLPAYDYAGQG